MSTPAGLHQFRGQWACNACGEKFDPRSLEARKAAREHVSTHKEVAVAEQQQGAWDVRVVIERKAVAAQSGIEAISAVTAQLDREGIVVAEVHAHRADGCAVEVRGE
jgi:phage terminase large subunit GpA-like protein